MFGDLEHWEKRCTPLLMTKQAVLGLYIFHETGAKDGSRQGFDTAAANHLNGSCKKGPQKIREVLQIFHFSKCFR